MPKTKFYGKYVTKDGKNKQFSLKVETKEVKRNVKQKKKA